MSKFS